VEIRRIESNVNVERHGTNTASVVKLEIVLAICSKIRKLTDRLLLTAGLTREAASALGSAFAWKSMCYLGRVKSPLIRKTWTLKQSIDIYLDDCRDKWALRL